MPLPTHELDSTAALIVVDLQNDFADPRGALYVTGAEQVVDLVNELVERARKGSALVVYTRDWHPPITPHFAKYGGSWPQHCIQGTWGAEPPSNLLMAGPIVSKGTAGEDGYSGFFGRDPIDGSRSRTTLDSLLRAHGVLRVFIVGLATDYCVKHTALHARQLGYRTIVLAGATRPVERVPGDGQSALRELQGAGVEVRGSLGASGMRAAVPSSVLPVPSTGRLDLRAMAWPVAPE